MSDPDRLYDTEPDKVDAELRSLEIDRAAYNETKSFPDRLDEYATSGTEAVRKLPSRPDGEPINVGAGREFLAGRDIGSARDFTGVGEAMVEGDEEVPDENESAEVERLRKRAYWESLQANNEITIEGRSSSSTGKRERAPNAMERHERQERRMRAAQRRTVSDAEKAEIAKKGHVPSTTGRPMDGDSLKVSVGRVEADAILTLKDAGLGENVNEQVTAIASLSREQLAYVAKLAGVVRSGETYKDESAGRGAA